MYYFVLAYLPWKTVVCWFMSDLGDKKILSQKCLFIHFSCMPV